MIMMLMTHRLSSHPLSFAPSPATIQPSSFQLDSGSRNTIQSGMKMEIDLANVKTKCSPWSTEEDSIVVTLVAQFGVKSWSTIAEHLPHRY
jgi:hypothetical protein